MTEKEFRNEVKIELDRLKIDEKQVEDKHSMQSDVARRQGHNKLVYDKIKKTIVTVPTADY